MKLRSTGLCSGLDIESEIIEQDRNGLRSAIPANSIPLLVSSYVLGN